MSAYPVQYTQDPPEQRNRMTVFFRGLMIIPHLIVMMLYGTAAFIAVFVAWFAIVFTGKYPEGIYDFVAGFVRFYQRAFAYWYLVTDDFPPFDGGEHPEYPVQIAIGRPLAEYNRVKTLFRIIIMIPVYVIQQIMSIWAFFVAIALWFVAVFTGRTSPALTEAMRLPTAYLTRSIAYMCLLTEDWPPFDPGPNRLEGSAQQPLTAGPEAL